MGQNVYYAAEKSGFLMRNCCGNLREFDMIITDNYGKQVMELHRPLRCQFPCGLQVIIQYSSYITIFKFKIKK